MSARANDSPRGATQRDFRRPSARLWRRAHPSICGRRATGTFFFPAYGNSERALPVSHLETVMLGPIARKSSCFAISA